MTISERIRLVRVRSVSTPDDRLVNSSVDRSVRRRSPMQPVAQGISTCGRRIPCDRSGNPARGELDTEPRMRGGRTLPAGDFVRDVGRNRSARVMFQCGNATGRTIHDAINLGIGQYIVDSESAVAMLSACADQSQHVLVDVTCGQGNEPVAAVLAEKHLALTGYHSEADNPEDSVLRMMKHMADVHCRRGLLLPRMGVAVRGIQSASPEAATAAIEDAAEEGCARFRLPRPALTIFPDWIALTHDM